MGRSISLSHRGFDRFAFTALSEDNHCHRRQSEDDYANRILFHAFPPSVVD
jgi:hypothetical protein